MQLLTWRRLLSVGLVAGVFAWLVTTLLDNSGATPLPVPWTFDAVCVSAGVVALWFGWQVRQYQRGKRPSLDGLRAARTAVLAQATAYVGVIITGACGGYALALLEYWGHAPRRDVIVSALVAGGAAVIMLVAGVVAERWCRYGGDDPEPTGAADPA